MAKHILLTGGSGLVGKALTGLLLNKGYRVNHLSRSPGDHPKVKTFLWDVDKGQIDEKCITGVDTIIHLAGAGIADERWTDERKKELIDSRTKSIGLVYQLLRNKQHQVTSVISASATGFYGDRGEELLTETSAPANDFLSECCVKWELAVDKGKHLGLRVVKFRTGVVLTAQGGALPLLAKPIKLFLGSPLGSGSQWVPWIHAQDVAEMYYYGIENTTLKGVYNMVAPNPVTNKQLTKAVAKQLLKPLWAPNVPGFVLKLLMGEMSTIVLGGTRVSAQKIEDAGFIFKYPKIEEALADLYS